MRPPKCLSKTDFSLLSICVGFGVAIDRLIGHRIVRLHFQFIFDALNAVNTFGNLFGLCFLWDRFA